MTDIVHVSEADGDEDLDRFLSMTPQERQSFANSVFGEIHKRYIELGKCFYAMKQRGDDMESVRLQYGGVLYALIRIGAGQTLPSVYVRFGGHRELMDKISNLDPEDQRRLAAGEKVKVLCYTPEGKQTHRLKDPRELTSDERRQVFARDHIRTESEQASELDRQNLKKTRKQDMATFGPLKCDRVARTARCGNDVATLANLRAAVRFLSE